MANTFKVVIPARYGASRLPGKPLLEIAGRPLLQYAYDCACRSNADEIIIATDDERIRETAENFGAKVCITSADHPSGTDRISEVVDKEGWGAGVVVINLQGDEPLMPPQLLDQVAEDLAAHADAEITTVCTPIDNAEDFHDPNVVKVVRTQDEYALYFSRAPIPWDRDHFIVKPHDLPAASQAFRHIGLYGYRAGFLRQYPSSASCPLESSECLEQLRALWQGKRIRVVEAIQVPGPGVDTAEDLQRVARIIQKQ